MVETRTGDLVKIVAHKTGFTQADCKQVLAALWETIGETLVAGGAIRIATLGIFRGKHIKGRLVGHRYGPPTYLPDSEIPGFYSFPTFRLRAREASIKRRDPNGRSAAPAGG